LAARTAADLAAKSGSELHVLTVAPEIGEFDQLVGMQLVGSYVETLQAIEQETRGILEEQAKNIEEAGGTVEDTHLEIGEPYPGVGEPPDRAIVHLSEDKGAALIVIGSRGHGGVRRAVMGSVSDSVVRHALCPVLMVRRAQAEV
jgi:nucleotide-binding universal stress UspA family protein